MTKEKHRCVKTVYRQYGGRGRCSRNGVLFEEDEHWCRQHAPSEVQRRDEAWQKKYEILSAVGEQKQRIKDAEQVLIEAAVEWLRDIPTYNEGSRRVHLTRTIRALLKAREGTK